MSIKAVAWALKQDIKPAIAKLLLVALANYADDEGKCWPSITALARDCSYDKDHVRKTLRKLEEEGWVATQERSKDGGRLANLYTLIRMAGGAGVFAGGVQAYSPGGGGRIRREGTGAGAPLTIKEPSKEPSKGLLLDKSSDLPKADALSEGFDEWYATYPRHVGKGQALRAYRSARRKKVDPAALLEGARKACERYSGTDQKFIPHPATWLNGERWLDEWKPAEAAPTDGGLSMAQLRGMLVEIDQELRQGVLQ